jgi:hypothetical protein
MSAASFLTSVAPRSSPGWIEVRDWQKAGKAQQPTLDESDHKQVFFFFFFFFVRLVFIVAVWADCMRLSTTRNGSIPLGEWDGRTT